MEDLHTKWKRLKEKNHKEYDKADTRICGDCISCIDTHFTWLIPGKMWCSKMCVLTRFSMPVGSCSHYKIRGADNG